MKLIRNMSIKWKVMLPIIILAALLLITCLQSNIANAMLIDYSEQIAANLTEITPELQELLNAQGSLADGMKSSNNVKMVMALLATVLLLVVASAGVIRPLIDMNKKLNRIMADIGQGKGDLSERVKVRGTDEIGQLAQGINAFIESLEAVMH